MKLGDYNGWIRIIQELLDDEGKSKEMGVKGRKFVIEKFSWNKKTLDFLEICKKYL